MKKQVIKEICCVVAILAVLLTGWLIYTRTRTVSEFYAADVSEIQKIVIRDGRNGEIAVLEDRESIEDLAAYLGGVKVAREPFREARDGWDYSIVIYFGETELKIVNSPASINDKAYHLKGEYDTIGWIDQCNRKLGNYFD